MLNLLQLRELIIKPSLQAINMYSQEAEDLLAGTAIMESDLNYLAQVPDPIAKGFWMMEQITYSDLLYHVNSQKALQERVLAFLAMDMLPLKHDYLSGNMYASCIFARIKYYGVKDPIPTNIQDQASYWGKWYNTRNDPAEISEYVRKYQYWHTNLLN